MKEEREDIVAGEFVEQLVVFGEGEGQLMAGFKELLNIVRDATTSGVMMLAISPHWDSIIGEAALAQIFMQHLSLVAAAWEVDRYGYEIYI